MNRTLVVLESWSHADSFCRERDVVLDKRNYTGVSSNEFYGTYHFCAAPELRGRICGRQFRSVIFYDGMFSDEEIMYSLTRVRY